MATFRTLASGKIQATIRIKGHKPVTQSFTKKRAAQRWANDTESDLRNGKFADINYKQDGHLFSDLAQRYIDEVTPTKQNQRSDKGYQKITDVFFKGDYAENIDSKRVFEFIEYLETRTARDGTVGLSANTLKKYLGFISNIYNWAEAFWDISISNPVPTAKLRARKLRKLTEPASRDRRLEDGEEKLLLEDTRESFQQSSKYIPMHEICLVAIDTAMREGEIAAMVVKNVNFKDKTYHIAKSKTDYQTGAKGRVIPLSNRVVKLLTDKIPYFDGRFFPWESNSICQKFRRYVDKKGLKSIVFHDLRHEATSRLFELGLTIPEVATVSGHKDWDSLKRYTHLKPKKLSAKMEELKKAAEEAAKQSVV